MSLAANRVCEAHANSRATQFLAALCRPEFSRLGSRVLVVCAHPDDETVGAGTRLARLEDVRVVHVTDGAPADLKDARRSGFACGEEYSEARRTEVWKALALAGVPADRTFCLGFGDQQAAKCLTLLSQNLAQLFAGFAPEFVITHPYEGGHPDHDATAFAVHEAARLCGRTTTTPQLLEMTSYHSANGSLRAGEFLGVMQSSVIFTAELNRAEQDLKRRMFDCFETQARVLAQFPIAVERLRLAPEYDFTRPPHPGVLYYEQYPWGLTGNEFRELARESLRELNFGEQE